MRENFSRPQEYALSLMERLGCVSMQEIDYILHHRFNTTTGQSQMVMHSLEDTFLCTVDSNTTYATLGLKQVKHSAQYNLKTILAVQVAIDIIGENYGDFDTLELSFDGEDLVFFTDDNSFNVYVIDEDSASRIRFADDRARSRYENDIRNLGEERAQEVANKFIFVVPYGESKKSIMKMIEGLDVFMPHTVAFADSDDYFKKITFDYK